MAGLDDGAAHGQLLRGRCAYRAELPGCDDGCLGGGGNHGAHDGAGRASNGFCGRPHEVVLLDGGPLLCDGPAQCGCGVLRDASCGFDVRSEWAYGNDGLGWCGCARDGGAWGGSGGRRS